MDELNYKMQMLIDQLNAVIAKPKTSARAMFIYKLEHWIDIVDEQIQTLKDQQNKQAS